MESLKLASLLGLITLFALAQIATFAFKITRDRFYSPFHFAGGVLVALFIYSLAPNYAIVIVGTFLVGLSWEAYEYLLWRFILKDDKFKQKRQDTLEDLLFDLLGGLTVVIYFLQP